MCNEIKNRNRNTEYGLNITQKRYIIGLMTNDIIIISVNKFKISLTYLLIELVEEIHNCIRLFHNRYLSIILLFLLN